MASIEIKRFGLACGATMAFLYLGCMFVMWSVGKEASVLFFNSLLHGLDIGSIIRTTMPWWEMPIGIIEIFILGWLTGALIASIYNIGAGEKRA